jgi:hypothetical protein
VATVTPRRRSSARRLPRSPRHLQGSRVPVHRVPTTARRRRITLPPRLRLLDTTPRHRRRTLLLRRPTRRRVRTTAPRLPTSMAAVPPRHPTARSRPTTLLRRRLLTLLRALTSAVVVLSSRLRVLSTRLPLPSILQRLLGPAVLPAPNFLLPLLRATDNTLEICTLKVSSIWTRIIQHITGVLGGSCAFDYFSRLAFS